jgi:hypothetical protein
MICWLFCNRALCLLDCAAGVLLAGEISFTGSAG